jgi:hypothetical protein
MQDFLFNGNYLLSLFHAILNVFEGIILPTHLRDDPNYVKPYLQDPPKMTYEEYAALQRQIEPPKVAPLSVQPCNEIIGSWQWFNGVVVIVESGGTLRTDDNANYGTWTCVDAVQRKFMLQWKRGGWRDTLILSGDGRRLDGRNQWGIRVWGIKR